MSPEGTRVWRKTRRRALRGVRTGRHRAPQTKTETPMSASTAASLPQAQVAIATVVEADPEPDIIVECGFCHVTGPSSLIPENAAGAQVLPGHRRVRAAVPAGRPATAAAVVSGTAGRRRRPG